MFSSEGCSTVAYDQSSGKSAIMDFGPKDGDSVKTMLNEVRGADVQGDVNYQNHMSPNDLRNNYSGLTIQTNPEDTQKAIDAINAFNSTSPNYNLYGNNCTTVCRDVLHNILKIDSTSITPKSFWEELYKKWSVAALSQKPGAKPVEVESKAGVDYGKSRYGMDTFDLAIRLLLQPKGCTTILVPNGNGGTKAETKCY